MEAIVESVQNPYSKAELYSKLGNSRKATEYSEETVRERTTARNVHHTTESLLHDLERAERLGMGKEERRNLAQRVYDLAHKERKYDVELRMADILQLPEETVASIREQKLYHTMTANWSSEVDYLDVVKEALDGVLEERAQYVAEQAYRHLMEREREQSFDGENYLRAGLLAKEYGLGRERVLEAGRKLVEVQSGANYAGEHKLVEKAFTDLELPEEMVHPLMLRLFERYVHMTDDTSQRIAERHPFTDEEVSGAVSQAYTRFKQDGWFDATLRLRQSYPSIIQDQVPIEDLKTIVGVMRYQRSSDPTFL